MNIKKVAVIGHGLMGRGIIHSHALHGFKVVAVKRREDDHRLIDYFQRELDKKRLKQEEYDEILSNIEITTDISKVKDCQLVIESIIEDVEIKQALFKELDRICLPETILASNTSSIPIGKIGKATSRPDKIIGLHYMSPVPAMKLVEIVKSMETSEETLKIVTNTTNEISKIPVVVNDFPGFVVSRLVGALINEAIHILMQGVADVEAIDAIAKLGMNLPMGPLQLADEVGLDVGLNTLDSLYHHFKDPKYSACPLMRMMVETGYLGKKNGKGFYSYQ